MLIFGVIIFIHELGHFTTARIFGVAIKEFSIGMGPRIISRKSKKSGIAYSLRLFPIGGFVSMVGEDEDIDDERALNKKPAWQRFIIMASGAFMNLLLGIILMTAVVISTQNLGSTTILRFFDNSSSQMSGLEIGDTIVKVNDSNIHIINELVYNVMRDGIEPIDITVIRGGEKVEVKNVTFPTVIDGGEEYGDIDFYVMVEERTVLNVLRHSFFQSFSSIRMIWQSLIDLITGRYGLDQVSGPIGTTTVISEAAESGAPNLMYICALISLNLAIFNLLPFPALDGGRLVFLLIEIIRRKPIKPEYEGYVHFVGIVLLMVLMVFITYKDFMKLFIS